MNVGETCQRNVITVRAHDELARAAQLMREEHVGYLVVVEPAPTGGTLVPIGVVTDRDLVVSVLARNIDAQTLRAGDVMSVEPITVGEEESLHEALKRMRRCGVRRMPV